MARKPATKAVTPAAKASAAARPAVKVTAPGVSAKQRYKVKSPIEHDGEPYDVGDKIELSAGQAQSLISVGAIDAAGEDVVVVPESPAQQAALAAPADPAQQTEPSQPSDLAQQTEGNANV